MKKITLTTLLSAAFVLTAFDFASANEPTGVSGTEQSQIEVEAQAEADAEAGENTLK